MDLIDTRHLTLDNKTVAQWHNEVKMQAHHFTNKYEKCLYNRRYSVPMIQFYRKTRDTYFALNELLYHIDHYSAIVDTTKCLSCKHDVTHAQKMKDTFEKHYRLIIKCRDGYRFKRGTVLCHDI